MEKKIVMGSDHAGYPLKENLKIFLQGKGYEVIDVGCDKENSCDYPEFAFKLCKKVVEDSILGILICGTGIGMSISANRVKGIRAALCFNEYMAKMSRRHNNANVLCLGARVIGEDLALSIVEAFLQEEFEGGRHLRRINQIDSL
ncbi:ribose 5-phosphate isomerase B [Desulfothermus okinawensis JCM 13304]